jgi:hypothetical protein
LSLAAGGSETAVSAQLVHLTTSDSLSEESTTTVVGELVSEAFVDVQADDATTQLLGQLIHQGSLSAQAGFSDTIVDGDVYPAGDVDTTADSAVAELLGQRIHLATADVASGSSAASAIVGKQLFSSIRGVATECRTHPNTYGQRIHRTPNGHVRAAHSRVRAYSKIPRHGVTEESIVFVTVGGAGAMIPVAALAESVVFVEFP